MGGISTTAATAVNEEPDVSPSSPSACRAPTPQPDAFAAILREVLTVIPTLSLVFLGQTDGRAESMGVIPVVPPLPMLVAVTFAATLERYQVGSKSGSACFPFYVGDFTPDQSDHRAGWDLYRSSCGSSRVSSQVVFTVF